MSKSSSLYMGVGAVAVAIAGYVYFRQPNAAPASAETVSVATRVAPNQLRYPPGAPQLAYLSIQPVAVSVPPLVEPLPARITYDEDHTVRMYTPVAGRTVNVLAQPGQKVAAGEVLAWLQSPDYDTAVADLRKAQADHDAKQSAAQRASRLHEAGVIATRDLEGALSDARSAQAELGRAGARLKALGPVEADGRFALRAPQAGVVVERHLNPGQELRPDAADPAFVLTDPTHLDVVADVTQADANHLRVGQAIRVESDGAELPVLEGRIANVGVAMDAATRRVSVRAHLIQPPAAARPELFVRLAPLDEQASKQVAVPNSAIVTAGVNSFVFVERSPGLLMRVPVSLGHRGRDLTYVIKGLQDNDRVVTKGATLLDAELASDN